MDIYDTSWDEAAENNGLPPPNGFKTGEDAGDVKLTFREMMAALKRNWNLSHPTMIVGGDGDNLTLTPGVPITGYADGQIFAAQLAFDLGAGAGATRTLNVSGKGGKKLYIPTFAGGYAQTAQNGGEARGGETVFFAYDSTLDSGNGGFTLTGLPQQPTLEAIEIPITSNTGAVATTFADDIIFRLPYAFRVSDFRASLTVPQTSGTLITVYIYFFYPPNNRFYVLAGPLTIDNGETTSVTATTPVVIGPASTDPFRSSPIPDDTELQIVVTQVGDGTARGLKVALFGHQS